MAEVPEILQVRESDSSGYTRYVFADPIGQAGAGVVVSVEIEGWADPYLVTLHGQSAVEIPGEAKSWTVVTDKTETEAQAE